MNLLKNNKHPNDYLQKAYNKYGEKNFEWRVLKYCKENQLLKWEQRFIDKYNTTNRNCGYNMMLRADRMVMSSEIKEKIRQKALGRKPSKEVREKMGKSHLGSKRSEETKRKMSLKAMGNTYGLGYKQTEEHKEKIRQHSLKQRQSEESKKKISLKNTGKIRTEETKRKISIANTGHKHTKEAKEKMSNANKGKIYTKETLIKMSESKLKYKHLIEKWKILKNEGLSYRKIGKMYNVDGARISIYLKKYYIKNGKIFI